MSLGSLGRLGIEIYADTAQFTGDLGKAEKGAKQFAANVESSIGKLTGIFGGLAASLGAIKFANTIQEVADFRNKLAELNESGLGTVEALSRIQQAARLAGTPFEDVTGALSKMVRGLAGSEKETSKAGEALRRLGINARDSSGNLRDPAAIYEQLAGALDGYADGADKAAFAQAILGKGGERYLPMLKDMAEFGALQAKVTDEQARAAKAFERAQKELSVATDSVLKKIAGEFIPASTAFIGAMTDMLNANNGLKKGVGELAKDGTLEDWARTAGGAVANLVDVGIGAVRAFEIFGKAIGETGRNAADFGKIAAGALLTMGGNSVAGLALIKDGYNGLKTMGVGFKEDLEAIANRAWFSDAYAARYAANMKKLGEAAENVKPKLNSAGLGTVDPNAKTVVDPFPAMMAEAQKQLATAYEETLDPLNELTKAEKALIAIRESVNWEQISTAQRIQIRETLEQAAALQKVIAGQKEWNKTVDEAQKFADDFNKKQDDQTAAINAKATAINAEADNWGKLPSEIAAVTLAEQEEILARLKLQGASDDLIVSQTQLVLSHRNYVAALQRKEGIQAGEQMLKVWDDVASAGGRFFADLVMNGRSAFDRLRYSLKQFAADMLALFAKKWILNMLGDTAGANAAGAGTMAGSMLSRFGPGASGMMGTAGLFAAVAAAGYGIGSAGSKALGAGERGQQVGGITGALFGGLVGSIIGKLTDPNGPANRTADFGGGKSNYWWGGGKSAFGEFGITNDKWFSDKDMLAAVQAFQSGLAKAEDAFAKFLKPEEIQRVTDALAKSKNYSFGTEHTDFAGTLGEILRDRVNAIFSAIDPALKKWLDGFQGTGDELIAYANDLLNVRNALTDGNLDEILGRIPDITLESLSAMKQAGETLGQTLQRVVDDFLSAQNALNQAIAARNPTFGRDLVLSQRNAIGSQFAALTGNTYGADLAARMALNPQSFTGLGTEAMQLLATWLGLQTQLEQLDAQLATSGNAATNVATSFNNAANAADDYAARLQDSQSSLASFLNQANFSGSSPLDPQAKYELARQQLNQQFTLADAGNLDAIAGLSGFLQQFWDASQAVNSSGPQYNTDYFASYARAAALTGGQVRPFTSADAQVQTAALVAALTATTQEQTYTNALIAQYLQLVSSGRLQTNDPAVAAILAQLLARVGGTGVLASSGAL